MDSSLNFYFYKSLYKNEKTYATLRYFAWLAAISFAMFRASGHFDLFIYLSRMMVPMLYAYPIYRIIKNIFKEWQNETINFADWLTLLIYLAITILVVTDKFYIRNEWIDAIL